jgi:hypothetical protein
MRLHAPEIEDQPWCPLFLRDGLTDFLTDSAELLGLYDTATASIAALVRRHQARCLVDLCAGAGGPVVRTRELLRRDHGLDVDVVLTDLYPNRGAFARMAEQSGGRVRGRLEPTDATRVPKDVVGLRTVFNGFHHFRPEVARAIVEDAARQRQPFISLEVVERRVRTIATVSGAPLLAMALALARPRSVSRLLCSTLIPIIPGAAGWDGLMSCARAYGVAELADLTANIHVDGYSFRVEQVSCRWIPLRITMLIGEPSLREVLC